MSPISKTASPGRALTPEQVADVIAQACPAKDYRDKKVLLIIPDGTRTAPAGEISTLSNGLFALDVPVDLNRMIFDYDQIIIIGPVFPHEVVGFSGGNKYLFPGVAGPEILNFFHWLGAVITTPKIIGNKWTPVRRVVDRAGSMVNVPRLCFCMVVEGQGLAGLFAGTPEAA